jgi:hypothetical protein
MLARDKFDDEKLRERLMQLLKEGHFPNYRVWTQGRTQRHIVLVNTATQRVVQACSLDDFVQPSAFPADQLFWKQYRYTEDDLAAAAMSKGRFCVLQSSLYTFRFYGDSSLRHDPLSTKPLVECAQNRQLRCASFEKSVALLDDDTYLIEHIGNNGYRVSQQLSSREDQINFLAQQLGPKVNSLRDLFSINPATLSRKKLSRLEKLCSKNEAPAAMLERMKGKYQDVDLPVGLDLLHLIGLHIDCRIEVYFCEAKDFRLRYFVLGPDFKRGRTLMLALFCSDKLGVIECVDQSGVTVSADGDGEDDHDQMQVDDDSTSAAAATTPVATVTVASHRPSAMPGSHRKRMRSASPKRQRKRQRVDGPYVSGAPYDAHNDDNDDNSNDDDYDDDDNNHDAMV